jgi:hypothetical protein
MNQDFYIYEHIRPDTGAVFYVGKGCKKRAFHFYGRSEYWHRVVNKYGKPNVNIVAQNLTEELAFLAEQEYIDVLKRRGIKLINLSNGGSGTSGHKHTDKTKEVLRQKSGARSHTTEAKKKISKSVIKTYKTHKKSRPVYCITNNKTYFSLNEAARQLNLHRRCITMVCNKEMHHTGGYKFEWSSK